MMAWFIAIIWKFRFKPTKTVERIVEITQQQN
jgi:hypothetical protein